MAGSKEKIVMHKLFIRSIAAVAVALTVVAGTVLAGGTSHDHARAAEADLGARAVRASFHDAMRQLWEDHVTWTRLVIVSAATLPDALPDIDPTVQRLLRNQDDIGDAIKPFYGDAAGEELSRLLREHITVAADLIFAAKAGDATGAEAASAAWYRNADQIADFLAAANPDNWPAADMRAMMREHLDLTLAEAVARLEGRYADEIGIYDEIHAQILHMADMLSDGLIAQFPSKFAR
jgi:hypothetical protein